MRSKKRYTNINFTKRVDHQAGHTSDKRISEPAICKDCGALYKRGRWTFEENAAGNDPFNTFQPNETVCPACSQIETGIPTGFVYLKGTFLEEHKEEIRNLLVNEEERMQTTNPLARIMGYQTAKPGLTVTTTTGHLAQHFGRVLKNAYGGEVQYDFSHENKITRVYWERS